MALKTFNIDEKIYKEFSNHCNHNGISMSRRIERFLEDELEKIKNLGKKINFEPKQFAVGKTEIKKIDEHPLKKYC